MTKKQKVRLILQRLYKLWPEPCTALIYKSPWELLVATMLSAQTTDKQVNKITPVLFNKLRSVDEFAYTSVEEIDSLIKSINFHNTKARNIHNAAIIVTEKFGGILPDSMDALRSLPGVARKTANVVLGNAYGKTYGIAVDTHVMRLSRQFGLTKETKPDKIEVDLIKIVPKDHWTNWTHLLINFGREYCPARKTCTDCPILGDLCNL